MKEKLPWGEDFWPVALALKVDQICLRFEESWKRAAGPAQRPHIEKLLDLAEDTERAVLLRELLDLELAYRRHNGEKPQLQEYTRRFPNNVELLNDLVDDKQLPSSPALAETADWDTGQTHLGRESPLSEKTIRIGLTVTQGPHQGRQFTFIGHDTFLVGRSKRAHFRLPHKDKAFSRVHFLVEMNPPHCRLLDMHSRNGTTVNGRQVDAADLQDGDYIRAGRTVIQVAIGEVTEPITSAMPSGPMTEKMGTGSGHPSADGDNIGNRPAPVPIFSGCRLCLASLGPEDISCSSQLRLCSSCREQIDEHPQPIAGYQIARELGRGGMGVVYLAIREANGLPVALKTITPTVAGTRPKVERFLREATILKQLDHPHIVAFRDMGDCRGRLFFAMDYVRGVDAGRLLKQQGPLPVVRAVRLVCQLLEALEYAHGCQFVHRDIKPANLLLAAEGSEVAKLADFGLARVYQASPLSGLTMTGDVGGTAAFMAPEQLTDFRGARPAVDQYSAAATLYNLLTGHLIHDLPANHQKRLLMILQDEPVPIHLRRRDIPKDLAAIIHRALAKKPAKRFPDVRAFRQALEKYSQEQEIS